MRAPRAWTLFGLGTLAGLVGLALITRLVLAQARATAEAAVEAQFAEDLRAALSRMDLYFAPLLTRAVARAEGSLVESGVAIAAFRVELSGGNAQPDPAASEPSELLRRRADLAWNDAARPPLALAPIPPRGPELEQWVQRGAERSNQEYQARANANYANNPNVSLAPHVYITGTFPPFRAGALQPTWEPQGPVLAFGRRLEQGTTVSYQVFRFDWLPLAELLLSVTRDLFPEGRLEPVEPDDSPHGDRLATLPARLVVAEPVHALRPDPALVATLGGAWLLALFAAGGAALALRASRSDAARQRRFTTAVTHELRTPLTTFRLYGEMLARGMVPAGREAEYLRTIEQEAARLGTLVENVLAFARLEQGHGRARERVRLDALVERHRAGLERRCGQAGTALALEIGEAAEAWLDTDVEGVGLVLSNLVDNACKYGAPPGGHTVDAPLRLTALLSGERVTLALEDAGPGVPPELARAIFLPFERGGRDESDPAPGVGLGLALARDVARALGGDLVLEPVQCSGARFVLWLPRSRASR